MEAIQKASLVGVRSGVLEKHEGKNIAFLDLESGDDVGKVMTPARRTFGVYVMGERCAIFDVNERYHTLHVSRFARGLTQAEMTQRLQDSLEMYPPVAVEVPVHEDNALKGFALVRFANHAAARAAMDVLRRSFVVKYGNAMKGPVSRVDQTLHTMRERLKRATEMNLFYQAFLEQHGFVIDAEGRPKLRDETQQPPLAGKEEHGVPELASKRMMAMPNFDHLALPEEHAEGGARLSRNKDDENGLMMWDDDFDLDDDVVADEARDDAQQPRRTVL